MSFSALDHLIQAADRILSAITQGLSQLSLVAQGLGIEVGLSDILRLLRGDAGCQTDLVRNERFALGAVTNPI